MSETFDKVKSIILKILGNILISFVLTVIVAYFVGFSPFLVLSGSSEPVIMTGSLIMDYKCSYEDLEVGDYITFSLSGKSNTSHKIVAICGKGEYANKQYFEVGDVIQFTNRDILYSYKITKTNGGRCQILTMANNYNFQEDYQKFISTGEAQTPSCFVEHVNYSNFKGRVIYTSEFLGKTIFYLRNNFIQLVCYAIIFYIAEELLRFVPPYIRIF